MVLTIRLLALLTSVINLGVTVCLSAFLVVIYVR